MPLYFNWVKEIYANNPTIQPESLWIELCKRYYNEGTKWYHKTYPMVLIAKRFSQQQTSYEKDFPSEMKSVSSRAPLINAEVKDSELKHEEKIYPHLATPDFIDAINTQCASLDFNVIPQFSSLINTFLSCSTNYISTMDQKIKQQINPEPYATPIIDTQIKKIMENVTSNDIVKKVMALRLTDSFQENLTTAEKNKIAHEKNTVNQFLPLYMQAPPERELPKDIYEYRINNENNIEALIAQLQDNYHWIRLNVVNALVARRDQITAEQGNKIVDKITNLFFNKKENHSYNGKGAKALASIHIFMTKEQKANLFAKLLNKLNEINAAANNENSQVELGYSICKCLVGIPDLFPIERTCDVLLALFNKMNKDEGKFTVYHMLSKLYSRIPPELKPAVIQELLSGFFSDELSTAIIAKIFSQFSNDLSEEQKAFYNKQILTNLYNGSYGALEAINAAPNLIKDENIVKEVLRLILGTKDGVSSLAASSLGSLIPIIPKATKPECINTLITYLRSSQKEDQVMNSCNTLIKFKDEINDTTRDTIVNLMRYIYLNAFSTWQAKNAAAKALVVFTQQQSLENITDLIDMLIADHFKYEPTTASERVANIIFLNSYFHLDYDKREEEISIEKLLSIRRDTIKLIIDIIDAQPEAHKNFLIYSYLTTKLNDKSNYEPEKLLLMQILVETSNHRAVKYNQTMEHEIRLTDTSLPQNRSISPHP